MKGIDAFFYACLYGFVFLGFGIMARRIREWKL